MEKVDDKKDKEERTEEKFTKRPHLTDKCWSGNELGKIYQYLNTLEKYCDVLEKALDEAVLNVECHDCSHCNNETDEKCRKCLKSVWLKNASIKIENNKKMIKKGIKKMETMEKMEKIDTIEKMDKQKLLKKVKENFKKKRKRFLIEYQETNDFSKAFDNAEETLEFLSQSFTDEEKEKFGFNRVKVGVSIHSNYSNTNTSKKYSINVYA